MRKCTLRGVLYQMLLVGVFLLDHQVMADEGPLRVRYPVVADEYPREFDVYVLELLELALARSGKTYAYEPVATPLLVEERSRLNLQNAVYDIHWLNTDPRREEELIPVRIPLFKGLAGWRLLFIRAEARAEFASVRGLDDLRTYTAGQGHDWPDNLIFQFNRMPLITSPSWEGLFEMLAIGRIDYFPRSVFEIWRERGIFDDPKMVIEEQIALHYPAAYYFFVNPQYPELADAVEAGLRVAVADGSFNEVFHGQFSEALARAQLERRRIIELQHPTLVPANDPELWYSPRDYTSAEQLTLPEKFPEKVPTQP